ncbi:MAG: hypothetical protein KatS3mg105_2976 [Gemmatales bacterium]|nr:MAG: hypothetical protein KatS3mg105_2976 [Gemmatales bacterium]
MTSDTTFAFPGGRVVTGWWQKLSTFQPRHLWLEYLHLYAVDAPVVAETHRPLERFTRLILQALAIQPEISSSELDQHVHLGEPVVSQVLKRLAALRLVEQKENQRWSLTQAGATALRSGQDSQRQTVRRLFHFVASGTPDRACHFLKLQTPVGEPLAHGEFDLELLRSCLQQSDDWKTRFGFPEDVRELLTPEDGDDDAWQNITIVEPLVALFVLLETEKELLGFAVRPGEWQLAAEPGFALTAWQNVFPHLAREEPTETWLHAWQTWCRSRKLVAGEVQLVRNEYKLEVLVEKDFARKFRSQNLGDVWLLAGEGPRRSIAQVVLKDTN